MIIKYRIISSGFDLIQSLDQRFVGLLPFVNKKIILIKKLKIKLNQLSHN